MNDSDFVLCRYMHPNAGDHPVYGTAAFDHNIGVKMIRRGGRYFIDYGYRAGAGQETFLVHRRDMTAAPHLFIPNEGGLQPVEVPAAPPPAPLPIAPEEGATPQPAPSGQEPTVPPPPMLAEVDTGPEAFDLQTVAGITADIAEQMKNADLDSLDALSQETEESLQRFKGVGKKRAELILRSVTDKLRLHQGR